jgi:hypothetical protein
MLSYLGIIREVAKVVTAAAEGTIEALSTRRVEQEPQFTDRMIGRIEQALEGYKTKGVIWRAKSLTDRGRGAQESIYGADFMGVLDISIEGYSVRKGFLAQAKLIEPNGYISPQEYARMRDQCGEMLGLTPASFVFLYSSQGIKVVPAISVVAADRMNPHDLYSRRLNRFYEEHFASFIGDKAISIPDISVLEELADRYRSRSALGLLASEEYSE